MFSLTNIIVFCKYEQILINLVKVFTGQNYLSKKGKPQYNYKFCFFTKQKEGKKKQAHMKKHKLAIT